MDDIVGSFQAKTQFAELLDKVEQGAEVIITRRGRAVAKLVPITEDRFAAQAKAIDEVLSRAKKLRGSFKNQPVITQAEIAEWKREGRRYP